MDVEKSYSAVVAGHICLDIRHPDFNRQSALAGQIQPGLTYDRAAALKLISRGIPEEYFPELAKFLEEASTLDGGLLTGGGVSNTGIPLHYLCSAEGMFPVKLMAKVGQDSIGDSIKKVIDRLAPGSVAFTTVPGETSSYTIVMNDGSGHSMYAHYPGTNDTFTPSDIDFDLVAKAIFFEFSYPPLMRHFYDDTTTLGEMLKEIRSLKTRTFLDMHDLHEGTPAGDAHWDAILSNALPYVDVFCPSLSEALFLSDKNMHCQYTESEGVFLDVIGPDILSKTANHFLKMGAGAVMLKCGSSGLYYNNNRNGNLEGIELFAPGFMGGPIVDTTGAGDNAIAAFMYSSLSGKSTAQSLRYANAAGFLNVHFKGSVGAFKSPRDLENVFDCRTPIGFCNRGDFFYDFLDRMYVRE